MIKVSDDIITEPRQEDLCGGLEFKTTADIEVPTKLIDQVIGQEHAVEVIKKAASQRRHVMMIGTPGTGKSMLAKAMAELLPKEELQDVLIYHNPEDSNNPKVRVVPAGKGKQIVNAHKMEAQKNAQMRNLIIVVAMLAILGFAWFYMREQFMWAIIAVLLLLLLIRYVTPKETAITPKLLVTNQGKTNAPFIDGTGAHAGALLGDVRHDPFQSGGLETPAHDRVEAGAIHKSHKGVLFIDEINTLRMESQQHLLTAIQEGKFSITGQSERSSGAMVKTDPVPCDFIMVLAGNLDAMEGMHPALRSRIKGYGYELFMQDTMEDNHGDPQEAGTVRRAGSHPRRQDTALRPRCRRGDHPRGHAQGRPQGSLHAQAARPRRSRARVGRHREGRGCLVHDVRTRVEG